MNLAPKIRKMTGITLFNKTPLNKGQAERQPTSLMGDVKETNYDVSDLE